MKRAGIVLCGGRSRRMGRPKALLPWFGRSMIEHVVGTLGPCVDELVVVTSIDLVLPARLADLGARVVVDRDRERGPLAALRDGLAAARADVAFVTACDAPFLTAEHVEWIFERAREGPRDGPRAGSGDCAGASVGAAAAPIADGFVQVLSAVYPVRAWRDAEALLSAGDSSPVTLLERIGFVPIAAEALGGADAPDAPAPWIGFNTPEAYLALARRRDPAATALVEWRGDLRAVRIGGLADVLERGVPAESASGATPIERLARGELRVTLAEGELPPGADPGLPIGPGERVAVVDARDGATR